MRMNAEITELGKPQCFETRLVDCKRIGSGYRVVPDLFFGLLGQWQITCREQKTKCLKRKGRLVKLPQLTLFFTNEMAMGHTPTKSPSVIKMTNHIRKRTRTTELPSYGAHEALKTVAHTLLADPPK